MKGRARGTYAASALRAGDAVRRRALEIAFTVSLVCVAVVAAFVGFAPGKKVGAWASPGALSHAHRSASVGCPSCHSDGNAAASCTNCHDAATHRMQRPAHRALQSTSPTSFPCVGCHTAHDRDGSRVEVHLDNGVATTWRGDSSVQIALSASSARTWVPLVPPKACAACHDLANARDPVHRCVGAGANVSGCFDEHAASPLDAASVAAVRRVTDRAALAAVGDRAAESSRAASRLLETVLRAGSFAAVALGIVAYAAFGAFSGRRARRETFVQSSAAVSAVAAVTSDRRRLPVIDASRCLGCRACVDACAFDVLEISRFVAVVARPDACCSAVTCAEVCPNGSLTLVDGGTIDDRARIDTSLESPDAPGVFLAGDLTGVPLIKNAIRQGREVAERVAARCRSGKSTSGEALDLLIVGAGPSGLSATLRARELGLSAVTLEQGELASSIRAFPRGKLVFERPLTLPLEGDLWMEECTKEELILQWERVVRAHRLPIKTKHRVTRVTARAGGDGYDVHAANEAGEVSFVARHVLFAVGTRGTPRELGAPIQPAAASRVAYTLVDAASFAGRRVVVAGLGDAAMEAALALARQPGCDVTVTHRSKDFTRGSARNVADMRAAVAAGRIRLCFETEVRAVTSGALDATVAGRSEKIPFDQLFVLIGGTPPWPLLASAGVALRTGGDDFPDRAPTSPV